MEENTSKQSKIVCGVWGRVTPYPKGYGQRLWAEVLMPELRETAYPKLMKQLKREAKKTQGRKKENRNCKQ